LAIQTLAAQLEALRPFIDQHERHIQELFAAHPDAALFASLPGAGPALAPRLLVALGGDRSRFPSARAVSCYSGIAPVTEKSETGVKPYMKQGSNHIFVFETGETKQGSNQTGNRGTGVKPYI
jgi:transposase